MDSRGCRVQSTKVKLETWKLFLFCWCRDVTIGIQQASAEEQQRADSAESLIEGEIARGACNEQCFYSLVRASHVSRWCWAKLWTINNELSLTARSLWYWVIFSTTTIVAYFVNKYNKISITHGLNLHIWGYSNVTLINAFNVPPRYFRMKYVRVSQIYHYQIIRWFSLENWVYEWKKRKALSLFSLLTYHYLHKYWPTQHHNC